MIKNYVLILSLIFSLGSPLLGQIDLQFERKYFFLTKKSKFFNEELANTIVFYEDGTYVREEDTVYQHFNKKGEFVWTSIKITRMTGKWERYKNNYLLNDEEIEEYYCRNQMGKQIECPVKKEHIPLGRSEYLKFATITKVEDSKIYYKNGNHDDHR